MAWHWGEPVFTERVVKPSQERWKKNHPHYPQWVQYRREQEATIAALTKEREKQNQLEREKQRQLRKKVKWWKSLDGHTFEKEIAKVFNERGYEVRRTQRSGDEGIDLWLAKDHAKYIVQCKAHKKVVGPAIVRDLYGTLLHWKESTEVTEAWLLSTNGFSQGAKKFADGKPLRLITVEDLLA